MTWNLALIGQEAGILERGAGTAERAPEAQDGLEWVVPAARARPVPDTTTPGSLQEPSGPASLYLGLPRGHVVAG